MKRMRNASKSGWRRRYSIVAALALSATFAFYVASALGDAGNPILGTITGTVVPDNPSDPAGGVTVYVRGQWNWLTHTSDCNFDRAGTGVGIVWNDPNGADRTRTIGTATRSGTTVTITTTTAQTFDVGDHITVSGVVGGTGYNGGPFEVTARSNTSLKYTSAGSGSGSGGTVTDLDVYNGWKVQKSPITAYVGTQTAAGGNPVDRMVHPVDRGNQVEGYTSGTWTSTTQGYATNTAGDYPQGQAFADPSPPGITNTQVAAWKGGCGREPLTATASKGSNPERTGKTCADGTTSCSGHPWGSWGYEKNDDVGVGYSHHFAKRADLTTVCANFYDVHGGGKFNSGKFQLVNGASDITVNGNGDNSIQTNTFNTALGANCFSFSLSNSKTTTQPSLIPNDTATVTTTGTTTPTGTLKFELFGPSDPNCAGTPAFTTSPNDPQLNSAGQASTSNTTFVASAVGTWRWRLTYSGDTKNPAKTSSCGVESFAIANG
jgi:hypothetical protein